MDLKTFFPTRILQDTIDDEDLRRRLEAVCWLLEAEDEAGNAWCDSEGYDGYTSYSSLDDLPDRFPEFAELKIHLDKLAMRFADLMHWDMTGEKLDLAIWVNMLGEGGGHSGHIHPGSIISGTYYVSASEDAGQLKLEDPRLPFMMAAPELVSNAPEQSRRFVYLQPEDCRVFLWESWLRHEVMPHRSETPRLSISFNYARVGA